MRRKRSGIEKLAYQDAWALSRKVGAKNDGKGVNGEAGLDDMREKKYEPPKMCERAADAGTCKLRNQFGTAYANDLDPRPTQKNQKNTPKTPKKKGGGWGEERGNPLMGRLSSADPSSAPLSGGGNWRLYQT